MIQLMNEITDKPSWDRKVFDETITEKWRQEARDAENLDITEAMLDWVSQVLLINPKIHSVEFVLLAQNQKHNIRCVYGYNVSSGALRHVFRLVRRSKGRYCHITLHLP